MLELHISDDVGFCCVHNVSVIDIVSRPLVQMTSRVRVPTPQTCEHSEDEEVDHVHARSLHDSDVAGAVPNALIQVCNVYEPEPEPVHVTPRVCVPIPQDAEQVPYSVVTNEYVHVGAVHDSDIISLVMDAATHNVLSAVSV
jgi:hypothetical protein